MDSYKKISRIIYEIRYVLSPKEKLQAMGILFLIFVSSVFELLGVTAVLPFVEAVLTPDEMMQKPYAIALCNIFDIDNSTDFLVMIGCGLIGLYLFKNIFLIFSYYMQYTYSTSIQKVLMVRVFKSYMLRPYTFYLDTNSSEVVRGVISDPDGFYQVLSNLFLLATDIATAVMIGACIIYTDIEIAVSILLLMLVILFVILKIMRPIVKNAGNANIQAQTSLNAVVYQTVTGIKDVFVMQRKKVFTRKVEEYAEKKRICGRTFSVLNSIPVHITEGVCVGGIIAIVLMRLVQDPANMTQFVPKLAVFAMAAFKLLPIQGKITTHFSSIIYNMPFEKSIYESLRQSEIYEKEQADYIRLNSSDTKNNARFEKEVVLKNIGWSYPRQEKRVLDGTEISFKKGESIGFIGPSGSGKTTLSDILLGLLKPQQGQVLMDGRDVYAMPLEWAKVVGYVQQTVFLMDDTVRNNVTFGLSAASDSDVWDALERAQIKDFIESLPNGLDTVVGERGVKFSGGQRQRIAIARALYVKPQILVMDEATAALDNETEAMLMESIENLQGKMTLVIVAHRLTTVKNCDKIYDIRDGKAVLKDKSEVFA